MFTSNEGMIFYSKLGLRLEKRIEEAVPAGQQLQELGMRLRCDDSGSENVSTLTHMINFENKKHSANRRKWQESDLSGHNFSTNGPIFIVWVSLYLYWRVQL